jgi:hypothetical protein
MKGNSPLPFPAKGSVAVHLMEHTRGVENQALEDCRSFRLFPFVSVCVVFPLLPLSSWSGAHDSKGQLLWMKRNKRKQTETNGKGVCDYGPVLAEVRRGGQGELGVFGWQLKQMEGNARCACRCRASIRCRFPATIRAMPAVAG